jgi:hypothetical protein
VDRLTKQFQRSDDRGRAHRAVAIFVGGPWRDDESIHIPEYQKVGGVSAVVDPEGRKGDIDGQSDNGSCCFDDAY